VLRLTWPENGRVNSPRTADGKPPLLAPFAQRT
jgi:hypothetical protein